MSKSTYQRVELYCTLIDIIKAMKLRVDGKRRISKLGKIENNLNELMLAEIIKD